MAGKTGSNAKMSDICGTCRGTGTVTKKVQRIVKGESVTEDVEDTCPQCNGYGEYDIW